jgi:hypothetical protein
MPVRIRILWSDESVALHNKMHKEIASAINTTQIQLMARPQIRILNTRRNAKQANTAITHQNTTAPMALAYHNIIIITACMVNKVDFDVPENQ